MDDVEIGRPIMQNVNISKQFYIFSGSGSRERLS